MTTTAETARNLLQKANPNRAQQILRMSEKPIVLGGCGRSGTTLLLSVLSCHPHIFCIDHETVALCPDGYGADGRYNKTPDLERRLEIEKIYQCLLESEIPDSATRWCEKTPRNVQYFSKILEYFGDGARLIHIVRDGRDVITSQHPLDPENYWVPPHRWVQDVTAGKALEDHPQVFTVRYEDLLMQYETTVRKICRFIGETFHPAFLEYPATAAVNRSLAWEGAAKKLSTSSIGRWKRPEYAFRVEALLSEPGAVDLLRHFGYL